MDLGVVGRWKQDVLGKVVNEMDGGVDDGQNGLWNVLDKVDWGRWWARRIGEGGEQVGLGKVVDKMDWERWWTRWMVG